MCSQSVCNIPTLNSHDYRQSFAVANIIHKRSVEMCAVKHLISREQKLRKLNMEQEQSLFKEEKRLHSVIQLHAQQIYHTLQAKLLKTETISKATQVFNFFQALLCKHTLKTLAVQLKKLNKKQTRKKLISFEGLQLTFELFLQGWVSIMSEIFTFRK